MSYARLRNRLGLSGHDNSLPLETYAGTRVPWYKTYDRDYDYTSTWWIPDATIDGLNALMGHHLTGTDQFPGEVRLGELASADNGGQTLAQWLDSNATPGGGVAVILDYDYTTNGAGSTLTVRPSSGLSYLSTSLPYGHNRYIVAKPDLTPPAPNDAARYEAPGLATRPVATGPYMNPPLIPAPPASNNSLPQFPRDGYGRDNLTPNLARLALLAAGAAGLYWLLKREGVFHANPREQHEWDKWTRDWETDRSSHDFILAQQWKDRGELAGPRKKRSHYPAHRHHREYPLVDTYKDRDDMRGLLDRLRDHEAAERTRR